MVDTEKEKLVEDIRSIISSLRGETDLVKGEAVSPKVVGEARGTNVGLPTEVYKNFTRYKFRTIDQPVAVEIKKFENNPTITLNIIKQSIRKIFPNKTPVMVDCFANSIYIKILKGLGKPLPQNFESNDICANTVENFNPNNSNNSIFDTLVDHYVQTIKKAQPKGGQKYKSTRRGKTRLFKTRRVK